MKRILINLAAILLSTVGASADQSARPKIYGIAFVRFKAVDLEKSTVFYSKILGFGSGHDDCRGVSDPCFVVNSSQRVELTKTDSRDVGSFLDEVGYTTDDLPGMRSYLVGHNVNATGITRGPNGHRFFEAEDPEHNRIAFVELSNLTLRSGPSHQVSNRLYHAGWVVRDLATEKKFYCDLLGFRLYWYGGFKDADIDWYEIQAPDGDNWVEFMLNIPTGADHRELGVQNHFSLGVPSVKAALAELHANGLLTKDQPEIGRDGKWSFDIYDPDGNRVEFMEPKNAVAPCCHSYTAPHPAF